MSDPKILELEKAIIKSRSYLTRYLSSNTSYNHTGNNIYLQEPIKLDNIINNSNEYLEALSDQTGNNAWGIKIKKGVKHINIKAIAHITSDNDVASLYSYIRKNGNTVAQSNTFSNLKQNAMILFLYRDYLEVAEGDIIQLFFAADNSSGTIQGSVGTNAPTTQLSVQVVD